MVRRTKYDHTFVAKDYNRCAKLLKSCGSDLTLLALKGHLLIEEQLFFALTDKIGHQVLLESARLSFRQKVKMVKTLIEQHPSKSFWKKPFDCLENLNELRNDLAHTAEVTGIERKVDAFVDKMSRLKQKQSVQKGRGEDFKEALINLYFFTSSIRMIKYQDKTREHYNH
jgi:hypothetical protein